MKTSLFLSATLNTNLGLNLLKDIQEKKSRLFKITPLLTFFLKESIKWLLSENIPWKENV